MRSPFLAMLAACALVAGAPPVLAQEPGAERKVVKVGGVYRRPLGNDPATLDPARTIDIYSLSVSQQIFDGLVQFDQTLTVVPGLADFWRASRDGLTWTFNLRKGVKFHHGREVTADDVVFSLSRILDPRTRSGAADLFMSLRGAREFREGRARTVSGLVALDRHTVQMNLNEAFGPFVAVLAVGHAKIVPRDLVEQRSDTFGLQPVGTGPFKFGRWERSKEIVLTANPEYFGGPPRLDRIEFKIFPGEHSDAMHEEFQRGALEDTPLPTRDYRRIVADPSHIYIKRPMLSLRFYGFNTQTKPFNDRRVRQAFIYAIDREEIHQQAVAGRFSFARGILPPGTQGFNPAVRGYPYDPAKARDLLAQAGYPGGRGLSPVAMWSGSKRDEIVREHEHMQKYLAAVGFETQIQYQTDWPAFSKLLSEGKLPVFLYAWYADIPDPDNFLFKLFHSKGSRNFFGYTSAEVDELLAQARNESDLQRRVERYRRAEQLVLDDAVVMPVWHFTYERLFQPYVRSIEVSGLGDPYIPLRKIWLERVR